MRRDWTHLLGASAKECVWQNNCFSFNNSPLSSAVVIAHYSKLVASGIDNTALNKTEKNKLLAIIIVSDGAPSLTCRSSTIYVRKSHLSYDRSDPFRTCFQRFIEHLEKAGECDFALLEPFVPSAVALDILCQAFEIAHGPEGHHISSSEVSNTEKPTWWLNRLGGLGATCCDVVDKMKQERVPDNLIELIKTGLCPSIGSIPADWVDKVRMACAPVVGNQQHEDAK
jgi:hypothetical protein